MGLRCRDCRHFEKQGENDRGRAFGMCRAWGFSINENDGIRCTKREEVERNAGAEKDH